MTTLSMKTMKWPRNDSGETQNRARRAAAQIERIVMFLAGLAFFFSFTGVGGGAATATGAAETCTGGGGQSSSPANETVIPRTTTSSMSRTSSPSLAGVTSFMRLTTFVPNLSLIHI